MYVGAHGSVLADSRRNKYQVICGEIMSGSGADTARALMKVYGCGEGI